MALVRWDPVSDIAGIEIDSLNRMFSGLYSEAVSQQMWIPAVDVFETDGNETVIKAELPDMKREDIKITFENNVLTLQGERRLETEIKREQVQRMERPYGSFTRAFTLPATVDGTGISASYKDGLLTIRLPRREETKAKQIAVD